MASAAGAMWGLCLNPQEAECQRRHRDTDTLVREARRLCPDAIPVHANHRLYTDYHERILKAVDTCLPVEEGHVDRRNGMPSDGSRAPGAGRASWR
jgi:hypothetical protein